MSDNGDDTGLLVGKWIAAVLLLAMPVSIERLYTLSLVNP
jgi:hypothetical protein